MTASHQLDERLAFVEIDAETRALLRELRPLIAAHLPGILDDFYRQVKRHPPAAKMFRDDRHIRHARDKQLAHWDTIAAAEFSDDYVRSVRRIGEAHNTLGLEPRWYIGGYSFVAVRLLATIEHAIPSGLFGRGAEKKAKLLGAFVKAAMLDMDFAISVYLEAGERDKQNALERIAAAFEREIGGIANSVAEASCHLEGASRTLDKTADDTQEVALAVAAGSEEASTNVGSVAAAAEELTSSVAEVTRQVHDSSRIAGEAVAQAEKTDARITALSQAAGRIGDIVQLIGSVADQTNLLALNATIEAARAGEAGKGFAVVAQEVKALATQTAKATEEIASHVSGMRSATEDSVAAIKEIGATILRISEITGAIAAAAEQQGIATQEIARNIQHAAAGAAQVTGHITEVNTRAAETGTAAGDVHQAALSLSEQSGRLKAEVGRFLTMLRKDCTNGA
ncbi:methyl-accepting chemotaxis receptor protein [Rhodovulum sp. PH10]|uniref:globin-coupled sensor protein n=1 Tax=Rhodovulum sp. PH10 TaxID=1187851 RepID=UPI00027C26DA|nr:globin-coupled sensor protein [Rhodovulum sp. PH10]EJW10154.1 methyl-accepting chemotaxis receptor protein [Rhodovulum sp. PH10]